MELSAKQIELLKVKELRIFKEFIKACDSLGLTYYVLGGTLLGAVRHKGFIPWDDDVDVGMMRNDFEIFRNEAPKVLPQWCFLQDCYTDPDFPLSHIKLRDTNSKFVETSVQRFNINHGIFIDVFPIDFYPDTLLRQKIVDLENMILTHRINLLFRADSHRGIRILEDLILKILIPNYRFAVKQRNELYKRMSNRKSSLVRNYCGAWGLKEIVPASYFEGTKQLLFEEIKVTGPKESELYLSAIYGNYYELPPLENMHPHHYVESIDLGREDSL